MGKGLSDLQKFILRETYKKRVITNADILIKRYGFRQVRSGSLKFRRQRIGIKRYLSATASVARSLTRLRARGLLDRTRYCGGHRLTKKGIHVACNG